MRKKYSFLFLPLVLFTCLAVMAFRGEMRALIEHSEETAVVPVEIPATPIGDPIALKRDTNVLLRVDTNNITQENYDETVQISDDRSDPSEESRKPSEHVALVDKNMKIYWSASPLDAQSGVSVDVLGIFRKTEGGAEILENVFRDPNRDGIVMGKIKDKDVEGMEYYNLLIRVNGEIPQTFIIDPKLKMSGN